MFTSILHRRLASVGLASVIAVSALGTAGIAMAEGGPPSNPPSATGQATPGARHHAKGILKGLMQDIVAKSGLTQDAFKQGFKDGKSINDILGGNAATVKVAVTTDARAKIADALSKGTITTEQAAKANEKLPALLDQMFSRVPKQHEGKGDHDGAGRHIGAIGKNALATVAGVLNIDEATLKADLKSGKTIAEVAGATNTPKVIAALDAKADTAIDKAVTDGKIKPEKADAAKTKAHERITNFVNNGRPHRGDKPKAN
jgi:hypothetical protein